MKYNEQLISLILNTEQLAELLNKASEILDIINQSNDLDIIQQQLLNPQHYEILQQVASISDYLDQVGECVVIDFIDYSYKKNKDKSNESKNKLSFPQQKLIAIQLLHYLYHNNTDLYNIFSQSKDNDNHKQATFDVVFETKIGDIEQVTYQFLFDDKNMKWELQRLTPGSNDAEVVKDYFLLDHLKFLLAYVTPETINPFIIKSLIKYLHINEDRYKQREKKIDKKFFKNECKELHSIVMDCYQHITLNVPMSEKIDIIHTTYYGNAKNKPKLMTELLLDNQLFALKNSFRLISFLSRFASLGDIENLLKKENIKDLLLNSDVNDLYLMLDEEDKLQLIAKLFFEHANQEQLAKLDGHILDRFSLALPKDDFIKFKSHNKIKFDYPEYCYDIERLYKLYPEEFENILEGMLESGATISDIPRDKNILKHYVNLLFKHEGQWLYLIRYNKHDVYNHKVDLLTYAMEIDAKKTLSILHAIGVKDSLGKQYLPITMKAEEISGLITKAPNDACVLLDYDNILDTLRNDMFSIEPYGDIRHFDNINKILHRVPAIYAEKLMRDGLLFSEKGMPHFHHLSGFGFFGGKNPGGFISMNFAIVYEKLPSSTFMSALTEGLIHNNNVDRLFLKDIFNLDLLELAKILNQFPNIQHLELGLSLDEENQANIIHFFEILNETNPKLDCHIHVMISEEKAPFLFLTSYLSMTNSRIKSLTITPANMWVKHKLLDSKKPEFRNYFDDCLKEICQNNTMLEQISINGFSKSLFMDDGKPGYAFAKFPIYNTQIFSIDNTESMSDPDHDEATEKLLLRNRSINALNVISSEIRHFQNVLELLPWLTINNMPPEIIVNIFDRLKYQHTLSSKIPHYQAILNSIENAQKIGDGAGEFKDVLQGLAKMESFIKAGAMNAYYRFKPHQQNIDSIEKFLNMDEIQDKVIRTVTDWFCDDQRPDLTDKIIQLRKLNEAIDSKMKNKMLIQRSKLPLILELDGITLTMCNESVEAFCEIRNMLNYYQKATTRSLKQLRRDAYIAFQCEATLKNVTAWNDMASQSFDGVELFNVLERYNPDKDICKSSDNIFKKLYLQVFTGFDDAEETLFKDIMLSLKKYLKQKELPREKQCGKHKHLHKSNLFHLLKPESIIIFKDTKPRLYQILMMQRERLAVSIANCSVKAMNKYYGLFSIVREDKKINDESIISNYEKQISKHISKK